MIISFQLAIRHTLISNNKHYHIYCLIIIIWHSREGWKSTWKHITVLNTHILHCEVIIYSCFFYCNSVNYTTTTTAAGSQKCKCKLTLFENFHYKVQFYNAGFLSTKPLEFIEKWLGKRESECQSVGEKGFLWER